MATTAPDGFDTASLRRKVSETYARVALDPRGPFHFHRGAAYAERLLGYDAEELAWLPASTSDRFAGVGNPLSIGPVWPGEIVVDMGCGAGTDLLLAARRVGSSGKVIGIDMTREMRERSREGARRLGLEGVVEVREGFLEALPLESESADVVISNGVFNLSYDKERVFAEVCRVLRPGGRLYLADVVVQREVKLQARRDPDLWAACIGGAMQERELHELSRAAGLADTEVVRRFDCFRGTTGFEKVSADLFVMGVNFHARRPAI